MTHMNYNPRAVRTLQGTFMARERIKTCSNEDCSLHGVKLRSAELQSMIIPNREYGIDVITLAGRLRFDEKKELREVHEALRELGVDIGQTAVYEFFDIYLALVKAVHMEKVPEIRAALERQGGYILSIDGTPAGKGKVLYIVRDTISASVLYTRLCEVSDEEEIASMLHNVVELYGTPLFVLSDMQESIINAVKSVLPGIRHQYCHYHVLKDMGKALLDTPHRKLGNAIRGKKVPSSLRESRKECIKKNLQIKPTS